MEYLEIIVSVTSTSSLNIFMMTDHHKYNSN